MGRIYKIAEGLWRPDPDPYKNIVGYIVLNIRENGLPGAYFALDRNPNITVGYVNKYGDRVGKPRWQTNPRFSGAQGDGLLRSLRC